MCKNNIAFYQTLLVERNKSIKKNKKKSLTSKFA